MEIDITEAKALYEKFLEEKKQFQDEMKFLNKKIMEERKQLKQQENFFEKKMDILKNGFAQLDAERKAFEKEKIRMEARREALSEQRFMTDESVRLFFRGADNPLTLKKRYRDLIKIFHPDNLCGDTELLQRINQVYASLQEEVEWQRKA